MYNKLRNEYAFIRKVVIITNTVSFPGLLDRVFTLDRAAFSVFGVDIMWYGIIIASGFCLAGLYASRHAKEYGLDSDFIMDLLIWCLPAAILGARAYYVLHRWEYYAANPGKILAIRDGGLGFYGGFIAAFALGYVLCRVKKKSVTGTMDIASLGFILAQSIGRWGNFVNCEAFGRETGLPWGMSINGLPPVHPTFLYESLWNAVGFLLLHLYSKKRKFGGEIFLLYMAWYGFGRMLIEGLRTDSLYIAGTNIRVSQLVAGVSFVVCLGLWIWLRKTKNYKPLTINKEDEKQ